MAGVRFWRNGLGEVGSVRIAREVALLLARGSTAFRIPYCTREYKAKKQQFFSANCEISYFKQGLQGLTKIDVLLLKCVRDHHTTSKGRVCRIKEPIIKNNSKTKNF